MGKDAGRSLTTGNQNTVIGQQAYDDGTGTGIHYGLRRCFSNTTSGAYNVLIGIMLCITQLQDLIHTCIGYGWIPYR